MYIEWLRVENSILYEFRSDSATTQASSIQAKTVKGWKGNINPVMFFEVLHRLGSKAGKLLTCPSEFKVSGEKPNSESG